MIRNYLKTAVRNLYKNKLYSFINLFGLAIGTVVVLLLSLYVKDEWTFDQFHHKSDRIYRAWVKEYVKDEVFFNTVTPYVLGQELRDNFPEAQQVFRYAELNTQLKKTKFTEQEKIHVIEPSFFKVFDFNLIRGKEDQVLKELHSLVLTEEMGLKYFGDSNPMAQTLSLQMGGEWVDFTVTGVIEKAPGNSSIQYDFLIPFENTINYMSEGGRKSWTNVNVETYVLLEEGQTAEDLETKFAPYVDSKVAEMYQPGEYLVGFQALTAIHLDKEFPVGFLAVSDSRYPYILSGVALLILLLAIINFTSLAVGRSISRAREVGVRKTTGATRIQLMIQFWSEALVTVGIAVLLGITLAKVLLPYFNSLSEKQLSIDLNLSNLFLVLGLTLFTGLLSGAYPSFVLSGFSPIKSLRGSVTKIGNNRHLILRGLVSFQFVLSILLIICTLVMTRQLNFLKTKNLGYNKEQVVILPYSRSGIRLPDQITEGKSVLQRLSNELSSNQNFTDFAYSTHTFGTSGWLAVGYTEKNTQKYRGFNVLGMDERFLPMHEIQITEGRNFATESAANNRSVIVNEAYAKSFNVQPGAALQAPFQEYSVIGIAGDFNFESLHSEVRPLLMAYEPMDIFRAASDISAADSPNPKLSIKLKGDQIQANLASLRVAWKKIVPEHAFEYSFLDGNLDRQYRAESRLSQLISIATALAIFIACLGLFGMATLLITQRTKEIGVRKVLGASTMDILLMLNKSFSIQVLAAALLAAPLAWYAMNNWLEDFAYRINISWWIFVLAGAGAIFIAMLTVSFQSVKASLMNPVKSLRSD